MIAMKKQVTQLSEQELDLQVNPELTLYDLIVQYLKSLRKEDLRYLAEDYKKPFISAYNPGLTMNACKEERRKFISHLKNWAVVFFNNHGFEAEIVEINDGNDTFDVAICIDHLKSASFKNDQNPTVKSNNELIELHAGSLSGNCLVLYPRKGRNTETNAYVVNFDNPDFLWAAHCNDVILEICGDDSCIIHFEEQKQNASYLVCKNDLKKAMVAVSLLSEKSIDGNGFHRQ